MHKQKTNAFTLVELIVVITILTILWTIAFISLQWYSTDARDSTRISDLSSMKSSLELFHLDAWKYPNPTNWINVTYSGWTVWTQWSFWESVYTNTDKLDKVPLDPLTDKEYTYSTTVNKNEYQLAWLLEWNITVSNFSLNQVNAWTTQAIAIVTGNYNGMMSKSLTWSRCDVLATPSIIANDLSTNTDLVNLINSWSLVYNWYKNLPSTFKDSKFKFDWWFDYNPNKILVYTDTNKCWDLINKADATSRISMLKGLQNAYSWTIIQSEWEIKKLIAMTINETSPSNELKSFAASFVNNNLGGNVPIENTISTTTINTNTISWPECDSVCQNTTWTKQWDMHWLDDWLYSIKIKNNYIYTAWLTSAPWTLSNFYIKKFDYNWNTILEKERDWNNWYDSIAWIETDSSDNMYIAWNIDVSWINNFYISKIDTTWNIVWEQEWAPYNFYNYLTSINIDSANNIYVAWYTATWVWYDFYIRKLDINWNIIWTKEWDAHNSWDQLFSIKTDSSNNIYVAWNTDNWSNRDFYIAKLDSSWNIAWSQEWDWHSDEDVFNWLSVSSDNSIYVWWFIWWSWPNYNLYLAKLNPSNWSTIWTKEYDWGNLWFDNWNWVVSDSNNNVYITWFASWASSYQFYAKKVDSSWNDVWTQNWWDNTFQDYWYCIWVDQYNNIYVWWQSINANADLYLRKIRFDWTY